MSHTYVLGALLVKTAIYSLEYNIDNIDNVNITDRVMYFVLQELTSQCVMSGAGLYMWRVSGVASNKWSSSWTEACYCGHVDLVELLLDRGMLLRSRRSSGVPPGQRRVTAVTSI